MEIFKYRQLTTRERKHIERLVIALVVGLVGIVATWLIFFASSDKDSSGESNFNATIPEAVQEEMVADKQEVYTNDRVKAESAEREVIKTLAENMIEEHRATQESTPQSTRPDYRSANVTPTEKVIASTEAYRNMNKTLGSFYDTPKVDTEKESIQRELEELKEQLAERKQAQPSMSVDEQLELMEKSYELAAKYMPSKEPTPSVTTLQIEAAKKYINGKAQVTTISEVRREVVSSLSGGSRGQGFNTAVGKGQESERNTINICVHSDQTIVDGSAVKMRLLEDMVVGDYTLPKSAIITGSGKIQGERLFIKITTLEHQGLIIPVELAVVDSDGQEGIYIPNSMEMNAIKEVAANLGSNMGTTINLNQQDAANQILTDLGKGAIQGVSQYVGKKMREVKVHLKAGYKLMLYQEKM